MHSYSQRKNLFVKEEQFSLEENIIRIRQEGSPDREIPYNNIESIRLTFMPDRMRANNYRCIFVAGKKKYSFQSSSIIGVADYKDDPQGYKNFTQAFIKKVSDANPSVALLTGRPKTVYWTSIVIMFFALAGLTVLVFYLGNYFSSISWIKFVLILLLLPMALTYIQRNKPGVFTPADIPEKLLPKI